MSDFHQKLSRIKAFKVNDQHGHSNKTLVFKTFTDNIQEVCYTKVYKKVFNSETSAWFSLCWSRLSRIKNKQDI